MHSPMHSDGAIIDMENPPGVVAPALIEYTVYPPTKGRRTFVDVRRDPWETMRMLPNPFITAARLRKGIAELVFARGVRRPVRLYFSTAVYQ